MWKWIGGVLLVAGVGYVSYNLYFGYRAGLFNLPELDNNSYVMSFESGMRAIVVDPEVSVKSEGASWGVPLLSTANPDRRYIGFPYEVPSWFQDTWSYCHPPTDEERAGLEQAMSDEQKQRLLVARFEAICKIDADGESIWRGLIFSVPKQ